MNATTRSLWDVHSSAVDSELESFQQLEKFTTLMNSVPVKVKHHYRKLK